MADAFQPFVAVTNPAWFTYLRGRAGVGATLDEVNFWNPGGVPLKALGPGAPVFFRLKAPHRRIGGFGFYGSFRRMRLIDAWTAFGDGNGCEDPLRLAELTGRRLEEEIGCTALREATFWPDEAHVPWEEAEGWSRTGIQRGKTEVDPARAAALLAMLQRDRARVPEDLATEEFVPLETDERELALARTRPRVGQGTFRTRLLSAYGGRCAVTGEHTEVVLDAAHIQPYLGPRSNRLQNGVLLTKEFHALLDAGYVTITGDYRLRVSRRLRDEWRNGHRYYPYDERPLLVTPSAAETRPNRAVLDWHAAHVFKG
jgi:putative restriction endonuclease